MTDKDDADARLAGSMLVICPYPVPCRRRILKKKKKMPIAKVDRRKPTQMRWCKVVGKESLESNRRMK